MASMQAVKTSLTRLLGEQLSDDLVIDSSRETYVAGIRVPVVCGAMAGGTSPKTAVGIRKITGSSHVLIVPYVG